MNSKNKADVPRYIQIVENLLDQIESGDLPPGTQLPPERTLSELFGVNRLTLRRALARLEVLGMIIRKHGKGNFVAKPKIERQTRRLVSFTHGMERRGLTPGAKVITLEQRPAEASLAKKMAISELAPVYYGHRLRLINQEPVMLEEFWMPVEWFPNLENYNFTNRSTYEIIQEEYGISIINARNTYEPVTATEYEAELLEVDPGVPLMLVRRLAFDQNGRCVEYGKDLYRGDRFRFMAEETLEETLYEQ